MVGLMQNRDIRYATNCIIQGIPIAGSGVPINRRKAAGATFLPDADSNVIIHGKFKRMRAQTHWGYLLFPFYSYPPLDQ